ncbi:MAG: amino acid deaminase, partial [Nakamurella sp.]
SFAQMLNDDPELEIFVWVDSPESAALTRRGYEGSTRPLNVLVDRGGPGARTGSRTLTECVATARAVRDAPNLRLAGVAAWEGSLEGSHGTEGRAIVTRFCGEVADTFRALIHEGLLQPADHPVLTGGGSAFFDIVTAEWAPLRDLGARIVLRSGCYLTHDDGEYAHLSPFGRDTGVALKPALHVWAQVISRPEPELALLNAGRRDVPYDMGLPVPQLVRGRDAQSAKRALANSCVSAVNDQHGYLVLDADSNLALGEVVRMGISHPCTAFDKWTTIPVIDDADAADPRVIGAVRTYF